jgi:hypothetical protein
MGRPLPARAVSIALSLLLVSLLPLHPDTRLPATPDCPAAQAERCRLEFSRCEALHGPAAARGAAARGCAAEYAALCRRDCGEPVPSGPYLERLRELGPWWLAALPGGTAAWARLRDRIAGAP